MSVSEKQQQPPAEKQTPTRIPLWISSNITNTRSLKVLFRCWLATWSCLILILPNDSLQTIGQAAFFAMILTLMIPANMPISLFLLANFTLVLGSCIGWAWSSAAMAASLRARNQVLLRQQLQKTYSSIAGATNPDSEFQVAIFQGNFLDVKSTTVFGVFLMTGAYISGIIQAKLPKFKIVAIFMLIILDVMCSYGPLFPFAQYTLATILLIPIGCSIAISLACQVLIFPESLNTAWQYDLIKMLKMSREIIGLHQTTLKRMLNEDIDVVERESDATIRQLHVQVIQLAEAMGGQRGFLELEVTYGRLNGKDLAQLYTEVRTIVVRMFGLNAFFHLLEKEYNNDEEQNSGPVDLRETHAILRYRQHITKSEAEYHVELEDLLPILVEASQRTMKAIDGCLETTGSWLDESVRRPKTYDHGRWLEQLESSRIELQDSLEAFLKQDRLKLIKPYMHLFTDSQRQLNEESQNLFRKTARPLFICLVFGANLTNLAQEMLKAHQAILDLARKRDRNKIWFPTGLRKIGKIIKSRKSASATDDILRDLNKYEGDDEEEEEHDSKDEETENIAGKPKPLDPDALPPTRIIHHFGRFMSRCYHFFWSPSSVYGIRFAIVTFALWIPSVLPSSAYFVYTNRGLWALIMGQTGMALSGGELIFTLTGRLIGTLIGLMVGMLYWYMSCGLASSGNAYGLAAVCAIGFIPIVFLRIFAPPILMLPGLMIGITAALCIGYSWIDAHLVVLSNSGIGYQIAWRRALLVIIGMIASFIVIIFPKPPSTREMVRMGFAQSTDDISRLYSIIVEAWIVNKVNDDDDDDAEVMKSNQQSKLHTTLRARFIAAQGLLAGINRDVGLANLDISIRGSWPEDKYKELLKVHGRLLEAISQMAGALTGLNLKWRQRMLHTTAMLNPKTISEVSMQLHLLANALRTAKPLPHALTMLLESTLMNQDTIRNLERSIQVKAGKKEDLLTLEMIQDPQYMKYTAAVMANITFVRQLDKFRAITRDLVGELDLPGYDLLKQRYDERLIKTYMNNGEQA